MAKNQIRKLFGLDPKPDITPTGEGSGSNLAATRDAWLGNFIQRAGDERDETLARLDRARREAETNHRLRVAEAESAVAARTRELDEAAARDFLEAAAPLVRERISSHTRESGIALLELCAQHRERCKLELGVEPHDAGVGFAFAEAVIAEVPVAVNVLADPSELTVLASTMGNPIAWLAELDALERRLFYRASSEKASGHPVYDERRRRYEFARTCATHRRLTIELAAFDKSEEEKRNEAWAKTYVVPDGYKVV